MLRLANCCTPEQLPCRWSVRMANRIWGNETVYNYLKSGIFHHEPPFTKAMHWEDPEGRPPLDCIGVNNYSRCAIL